MNKLKFEELNISKDLLKALLSMGFKQTTPIQEQAIPEIISGRDVIGQASTGTGKTAAFGIPVIEKIDPKHKAVQVLVLCPTRELAMQVAVEINKFLKYKNNISALPIYGGQPISRQLFALARGPQIIIGTPGRTLDLVKRGALRLDQVKMVVLDEADEMLNMGFRKDIEQILKVITPERQMVLFSATMSSAILQLTKRYQKNPKIIKVAQEKLSVASVEQVYFDVEPFDKKNALVKLIDAYKPKLSIVFCNTKRKVDEVSRDLRKKGYLVAGTHGDIRQSKRDTIMSKFRRGRINILVATDVAARGIDIANVGIVFNYEIPKDVESYVHRIGRTGRAGKSGKALSLVSRREFGQLRNIMRYTKVNIISQQITSLRQKQVESLSQSKPQLKPQPKFQPKPKIASSLGDEHLEEKASKIFGQIKQSMNKHDLTGYSRIMAKFIGNNHSSADVAAALLKMAIEVGYQKI